jgi:DNA primase
MAAQRPYVSFADVKKKISIPEVLEVLGIAQLFKRKGDHLCGQCPLPQHRHGPRPNPEQFKIDNQRGTWLYKCFGDCNGKPGGAGDVIELVKAMTGLSDAHVRFWFADKFGDRLALGKPPPRGQEKGEAREDHGNVHSQAPQVSTSNLVDVPPALKPLKFYLNLDPAVPYLEQRGVAKETIGRYDIGLCNRGVLKGYVAMPIYNWPRPERQLPVAYFGRWPGEDFDEAKGIPRYKWPPDVPRPQLVFGLPQALQHSESDCPLVVVKSPFAVFHLVQQGFPAAVALCDDCLSEHQAHTLASTGRPILLLFDGGTPGQHAMRQAAARLIKRSFVRVIELPEGAQPEDVHAHDLARLLR